MILSRGNFIFLLIHIHFSSLNSKHNKVSSQRGVTTRNLFEPSSHLNYLQNQHCTAFNSLSQRHYNGHFRLLYSPLTIGKTNKKYSKYHSVQDQRQTQDHNGISSWIDLSKIVCSRVSLKRGPRHRQSQIHTDCLTRLVQTFTANSLIMDPTNRIHD